MDLWVGKEIIGSGVWGRVYDLGDGSVLKRVRRRGGIGCGAEKLRHEINMMEKLAPFAGAAFFAMPAVYSWGEEQEDTDGFSLWARMSKIDGIVYDTPDVMAMEEVRRAHLLREAVRGMVAFHRLLQRAEIILPENNLWAEMMAMGPDVVDAERLGNVRALFAGAREMRAVHGDFNLTNLVFDRAGRLCGLLDFAEMCAGMVEDDIAKLCVEVPDARDLIVRTYEEAAGVKLCAARLHAAEIKQHLLSLFIARYRQGDEAAAREIGRKLDRVLGAGGSFTV